jgi:hypothetical protein
MSIVALLGYILRGQNVTITCKEAKEQPFCKKSHQKFSRENAGEER